MMHPLSRRAALGAAVALSGTAIAQHGFAQTPRRWSISGAANTSSQGPANPYYVLANRQVQALALTALDGPVTRAQVDAALRGTDISLQNVVDTDVLRRQSNGRFALATNILTREDKLLTRQVANPAGASLAASFLAERGAFDAALARYDLPQVDRGVLAMALIGCVVLDWDGLDVTAEHGWRTPPVLKPNGDKFQMTMSEIAPDVSVRALYWGSHNTATSNGQVVMSTFGDHEAPDRLGFPDITGRISAADLASQAPDPINARLASVLGAGMNAEQDEAGRILIQLRAGPAEPAALGGTANTLRLLEALRYIAIVDGRCHAHVPVFTRANDGAMLDDVRARGRRIMQAWLTEHYARIRGELADLRAVRAGVPYEVAFTQIWHDLFGWTNYHFVQSGFLYDPYGPNAEWVSFVPFVWEEPLQLYAGTRIF